MDSKGLINIEILFCTIIIIMIFLLTLPLLEHEMESNIEIDENSEGRFLLKYIANGINQVNSNDYGFIKKIKLPESIEGNHYSILVNDNEIILEFNNKKGSSKINPINIVDSNNQSINGIQLYNGRTYIIKKTLINNNESHIINQSSIMIRQVEALDEIKIRNVKKACTIFKMIKR